MAINRNSDNSLSMDDILRQIGARPGDAVDFISLASVMGINTTPGNPIVLPDSFVNKSLTLSASTLTRNPTTLEFSNIGASLGMTITSNGVYRISEYPSWLVFDKTFAGSGQTLFSVFAGDNSQLGSINRSGTITITGSTTSTTISVSQAGNPVTATISPSTSSVIATSSTRNITLTLSNALSVLSTSLSNTTGFSLQDTVTKTVGTSTTAHLYKLDVLNNTGALRETTITFNITGPGYDSVLTSTVTQAGFVGTISIATTSLSFVTGGETKSFAITSNTSWTSVLTGTGYQQSLSETTGFGTGNLTGTGDDTIYIKALNNTGGSRTGTVTVSVSGASDSVSLSQAGLPVFGSANVTITGFDVNSAGTITAPTTLTPSGGTIVYSTATGGGGTTYTLAQGFPLVSSNTTRYITYTVNIPAGYQSAGTPFSKSVSAVQELATTFGESDISIVGFDVNYLGTISVPTVTPSADSIIYSTLTNGGGTTYTPPSKFPQVSSNTDRYCKATVTVPAGYFNQGQSVSRTIAARQEFTATIDVSPNTHTFSNVGSPRTYSVASNTTWVVSNTPTWITIDDTTGGGSDTSFIATAASQPNPGLRRSGTLQVSTNTSVNGIVSETVSFEQPPLATWTLNNIPNIGDGTQYSVEQLKSSQNTAATGTEFFFNIPYTFDYMNTNFDRTNFGFWVNFGAGRSTTSNRLTAGNKTFTITPNFDVNGNLNQVSYDVGQVVSIGETTLLRAITRYMIGTVTAWNASTRVLSVNISSTSNIITNDTTTNYTSWEINQISGDAVSFPRIYTRNRNISGSNITTTISIDDTNNTYEQSTLSKVINQPVEPLSGFVNLPSNVDTGNLPLGGSWTYTNSSASTTTTYFSVGIKTNFSASFSISKAGSSGVWISTTFNGSAQNNFLVTSSTTNTAQFYVRYSTGGYAEINITDPDGNTTLLAVDITPQSSGGGGGTPPGGKPPIQEV